MGLCMLLWATLARDGLSKNGNEVGPKRKGQ